MNPALPPVTRKIARTGYMDQALDPASLQQIVAEAKTELADVDFDTIVGTGFSGSVVIPAVAMALGKDFLLIRKEDDQSHHGGGLPVGTLGKRWIFLDDFISSGATWRRVHRKVAAFAKPSPDYWGDKTEVATEYVGTYIYINYSDDPNFKLGWKPGRTTSPDHDGDPAVDTHEES